MSRSALLRRYLVLAVILSIAAAAVQACSDGVPESGFVPPEGDDSGLGVPSSSGGFGPRIDAGSNDGPSRSDALGTLVVTPPTATINVTIVDGAITVNMPVAFTASYSGANVVATWLFDRGELGDV